MKKQILHLKNDPVLSKVIENYGELNVIDSTSNLFEDIATAIISQQLSVKAASTIEKRVRDKLGGNLTPDAILAVSDDELRSCGMSYSKIKYMKGLAEEVKSNNLMPEKIANLSDDDVIVELTKLKGIGRWTAEMILIFSLGRADIFSMGDLGLRTAIGKLYNIDRDDLKAIETITSAWKPYRSLASRYLWKSLDNK